MAFASAVLMFAGSPQTFLGVASAHESLSLFVDVLAVYARHVSGELTQALSQFSHPEPSSPNKRLEGRQWISAFPRGAYGASTVRA